MPTDEKPSPIEVWLSKRNMEIKCMVVREDESVDTIEVDSLSMRGAQREITGWFVSEGYKPVGRWEGEEADTDGFDIESKRQFKLAASCSVDGCSNPVHAKGYCGTHYDHLGRPQKRAVAARADGTPPCPPCPPWSDVAGSG
jgi:hypothetical protein